MANILLYLLYAMYSLLAVGILAAGLDYLLDQVFPEKE